MSLKSRLTVLAALALSATAAFGADPLSISVTPALEGFSPSAGTVPVAVNLRNDGPNARGVLRVSGGAGFQMDYPIELPRGSVKRLITYPTMEYGSVRFLLDTDQGRQLKEYNPGGYGNEGGRAAVMISDTPGELSFIKGEDKSSVPAPVTPYGGNNQNSIQDAYTVPGLAPNRPVGYANVATVFLGSGSERLNDEQVQALKLYALAGGTLVFVGGASSPILGDARWRDILPAREFRVVTLNDSNALASLGGEAAPPVSVTTGVPTPGAIVRWEGGTLLTAERGLGIGKVIYLAFNPFEPPLNRWDGRRSAVTKSVRVLDSLRASAFLQQYGGQNGNRSGVYGGSTAYVSATMLPSSGHVTMPAQDPFSTKLPPAEKVFTLLGAYFVVVVPLNFLILKKLKRGELAWFTAPLISLGFAGAFFASAQDLYSARMSSASQGILIAQQGMEEGLFVGASQMFVPRSGTYDLKLNGVDSLGILNTNQPYYGYGGRQEHDSEFDPVDVGQIIVPRMQANNLSFREIDYRQRVPVGRWFSLETKRSGSNLTCVVRNTGTYRLENAAIQVADQETEVGTIEPGQTREIKVRIADVPPVASTDNYSLPQFLTRNRGTALIGSIRGFRPGPQLGEEVAGRTSVRLALIAKEALGPR
ncbi:hypothetical protein [Fimbriimonas ginsengisoli]|uniref:Uncharacterized protein n=1 Tax=Fimbriimonas ginsengisoli Gsoil 348 TaxID=661478 RepID=A0A068NMB3_FIMGI|nr:hypothetical protein [Fimbriimonas ginsengisoli]AIE83925.1 hypothetical protein OP10G_0557 [Fimbriimonas ginsengisoli Gsoil 348]